MSDLEAQIKLQIFVIMPYKESNSIMAKNITEEEKQKYKAYFKGETGIFVIEKLTRDIIERCKLPETIELRKKLACNHDDIIVREEKSIAEKIIKRFLHDILC